MQRRSVYAGHSYCYCMMGPWVCCEIPGGLRVRVREEWGSCDCPMSRVATLLDHRVDESVNPAVFLLENTTSALPGTFPLQPLTRGVRFSLL